MKLSQAVGECNYKTVIVHYDLAIAKLALQIQASESPQFDNLFICFGPFHILLAFILYHLAILLVVLEDLSY